MLATLTTSAGLRTVAYDGRGNTLSETRPGSVTLTTAYDGHGRLTSYTRSDSATLAFAYNGLDERTAMTRGSDSRRFVYAPDGRALGEYGASTADVKAEFIWAMPEVASGSGAFGGGPGSQSGAGDTVMGYAPLAVATPDNSGAVVINWIHASHLGVPQLTLDASGNPSATPNDYLLPGFPGQARVLADLYYNRYRDYDPTTGRYIQADPIGLGGGSNLFAYAGNNPVGAIDPWGLEEYQANPLDYFTTGPFGIIAGVRDAVIPAMRGARICIDPLEIGADLALGGALGYGGYRLGKFAFGRFGKFADELLGDASGSVPRSPIKEGRYEFPDLRAGGQKYVGESGDIPVRLRRHERAGRYEPGSENVTEVLGGRTAREVSEHLRIREITGGIQARNSNAVSNQRDPIGAGRLHLLPKEE